MSYKVRSSKLRKHRARDNGWTRLFDGPCPTAFISRPERRTLLAKEFQPHFAADVAVRAKNGKPSLCFNEAHDYEFSAVPDVFAVVKMADDAPPMVMGICPECATKTDAELYSIMRGLFNRFGVGKADDDADHTKAAVEIKNVAFFDPIPGVHVGIALRDENESPSNCEVAMTFAALLQKGALPRFMAFRLGQHNCHAIVEQLYLDFKEFGVHTAFSYKRGSSAILAGPKDPDGLHSWIEARGWAIDASGGAAGNPIMVQRVADFYERMKVTNVHDIEMGKSA